MSVPSVAEMEGIRVREVHNTETDPRRSVAIVWVAPGTTTALHRLDVDESQRVVMGTAVFEVEGCEPRLARDGDVVVIPRGKTQRVSNLGAEELEVECTCTPRFTEATYHHVADRIEHPRHPTPTAPRHIFAAARTFDGQHSPPGRTHEGQVAVVTGGYGGIGFEACRQLGHLGFTVILTGRRQNGEGAAALLQSEGLDVRFVMHDVVDRAASTRLAEHVRSAFGRCDVLVNNAAVLLDGRSGLDDAEVLARTMAVNRDGARQVTESFLPLMRDPPSFTQPNTGRIIQVSSGLGARSSQGGAYRAYSASKLALNDDTRALAKMLADTHVVVNAIDPGWVRTAMGGSGAPYSTLEGVQAILWLATTTSPPNGEFVRRSTSLGVPPGLVALERAPW